jgi:limonene-1,2-epoxide hydrolase
MFIEHPSLLVDVDPLGPGGPGPVAVGRPIDRTGADVSLEAENVVRGFLESLHADGQPDWDSILDAVAENATYHMLVPRGSILDGRKRIREELERQFTDYSDCECELLAIVSNERTVMTERRDHVTMNHNGQRIFSSVAAIFELDEDGRITHWREYWDSDDIAKQLGMTREQMDELQGGSR